MKTRLCAFTAVLACFAACGLFACGGGNNPPVDVPQSDVPVDVLAADVPADALTGDVRPDDVAGTDVQQVDTTVTDVQPTDIVEDVPPVTGEYTILAWNNLGMHCYNSSFKTLAVLPPFNTLWAQVIRKGNSPDVVTAGLTLEYSFPGNTWSGASTPLKSDFWVYVADLFGVTLVPDAGLTGKELTGTMDVKGDHFEAEGIPITEFRDVDAVEGGNPRTWNRYPYQLATIIVKETATGRELTRARVVAPVSSEMNCQNCHGDAGSATTKYNITPSGTNDVDLNILRIHDHLSETNHEAAQPVLCATCHASNALGMTGNPALPNLSNAMHSRHSNVGIPASTAGCYSCHPGPETQCLRDVMSEDGSVAGCIGCHGNIAQVAANPNPWLNEPRCDSLACHGSEAAQDKPLYNVSKGHHGVYCAGCHDSPHAIAPSREANDGIKFMDLQGDEGPVKECNVCHTGTPDGSIHEDN